MAQASGTRRIRRVFGAVAFLSAAAAAADDPHPMVETRSGYFLGASSGGKSIKAEAGEISQQ